MNQCSCKFCGSVFEAVRNDAIRCKPCRKKYEQEYRRTDDAKARRAKQHRELREKAFAGYGGNCACCGEDKFEFLAIDHVNGGGRKERETTSTYQIARKIINLNYPSEYRVLCHNCNQAIGWYGKCPHESE